ncbi:MAG: TIGR03663 family protein [Anaerolineales bacterium]|nr:TIGR03663 family protein [Anaerolineales bacterium]
MTGESAVSEENQPWSDRLLERTSRIDLEASLYIVLILLAVFTRFYALEARVMSHDESLHTQFSWYLVEGRGFSHDPLMHGPFQMHAVALSYFLFGDSDATARFPAAFAGVLAVLMVLLFRKWLGRWGTLAATAMMVFSPYMLYYSRYVRNEMLVVPMALLMFYAVFRYFETRHVKWLYLLAASLALHFTTKETSFIYTAQLLLFLGLYFAWQVLSASWSNSRLKWTFVAGLLTAAVGGVLTMGSLFLDWAASGEVASDASLLTGGEAITSGVGLSPLISFGLILAVAGVLLMMVGLIFEYGRKLRSDFPAFDLIVVVWTMTMPQLAALPANIFGWDPLEYNSLLPLSRTILLVVLLLAASVAIGATWNWRKWLVSAAVFFGIFVVFQTTLFTNEDGLASGLVGSLGYWLEQHGVERGGQPWFYYLFLQIPLYEFLPAIGALGAGVYALRGAKSDGKPSPIDASGFPVIAFLGYWALTAITAYSFAGEKMPWLTVHIALPLILFGGWGIGKFIEQVDWSVITSGRGWLIVILVILLLISFTQLAGSLLGGSPPFQGNELDQLRATNGFLTALAFSLGAIFALWRLTSGYSFAMLVRLGSALTLLALFGLTVRSSLRASFVHYDLANEYLVYAHSAPGVKTAMRQIEDLSRRTTDGLAIQVAYDDDVSWPLNWYLRDYTGQFYFGANPTRELLNYPVILVGDNNWQNVEPLLRDGFFSYEYIRMWWPNQDYWALKWSSIESERDRTLSDEAGTIEPMGLGEYLRFSWQHIKPFFTDRDVRAAIWEIWLNRDFTKYGQVAQRDLSMPRWSPADRMRLYIRKDIAAQVWDYGVSPAALEPPTFEDPYADRIFDLQASLVVGQEGLSPGDFFRPRDLAIAQDGSIYVADTANHRIQHLSPEGEVMELWGTYGNRAQGDAPGGSFNEPWGIAVAPDGNVYVADTWNHRIQWFTPEGEFIGMFGQEGYGETANSFWGPRDVAVDREGRVYVSDTGNKYIKVFDREGAYLGQFGGAGYLPGYLDEPVGLAVSEQGTVYVVDTWNQRVQGFLPIEENNTFAPVSEWEVDAWYGQSLENKPYIDTGPGGIVCTTDPEAFRVLCFLENGEFVGGWGGIFGMAANQFDVLSGVAVARDGTVWVVDSGNHRVMRFEPSFLESLEDQQ